MERKKIAYRALDNGFLSCADARQRRETCDSREPEDRYVCVMVATEDSSMPAAFRRQ
jgi:hypothetical protein